MNIKSDKIILTKIDILEKLLTENHPNPEKREDEIFITNCKTSPYESRTSKFESISYKTKRKGVNAYGSQGNIIGSGMFPVFIKKKEIEEEIQNLKNKLSLE